MTMHDRYITVSALTKYIKKKMDIDPHLQNIWLRGEISNFKHHNRGHMYLTIKDETARIQAVMFAGNNRSLNFMPENGMKVLLRGEVTVFESYGQYQLYIREMSPDGIGALYLAFEQLKEKLTKERLFDAAHKKKIPLYPEHIGVITSPTGAAIRDILSTIKRRYPIVQLTVFPVIVQGDEAAPSIVQAIAQANKRKDIDTLIIGRGGGSIEDLWSFNDERVARAIYSSDIPVISGVGHETDTTISDFVADLRAATPTGAAELAVPSLIDLQTRIEHIKAQLTKVSRLTLMRNQERLKSLQQSYAFHKPKQLLYEKEQHIDRLTDDIRTLFKAIEKNKYVDFHQLIHRLNRTHPEKKFKETIQKLEQQKSQINKSGLQFIRQKRQKLNQSIDKLTLLNPLHTMKRGFAIPYAANGEIIKSVHHMKEHDAVAIRILDGTLYCQVNTIRRHENG